MKISLRKIILAGCFFTILADAKSQGKISMNVNPSTIGKDEYTTLRILIENVEEVRKVSPPSFDNFIVLSGPNEESGIFSKKGQTGKYVALVYLLKPRVTGKINIDAATVSIGNKNYKTNTALLFVQNTVSSKSSGNAQPGSLFPLGNPRIRENTSADFNDNIFRPGDDIAGKIRKNIFLRVETDKTCCYVGEPVIATYKLYTRLKSESKLSENPSFNGFSVIDLTSADNSVYTREIFNGREYNVYVIRKAQLYPLQPGRIELETAELENNIQFLNADYLSRAGHNPYDLYDDFTGAGIPADAVISQTVILSSKPVFIEVKALPEGNKPANFSGAVGKFSLDAHLQKSAFPVNESGKLIIKISGSGNLPLFTAPLLNWPTGIAPFDPKGSEELNKTTVPVTGTKTFEFGFSADTTGNYLLPEISFSYFDPSNASYKTIRSEPFEITVTPASLQFNAGNIGPDKKETVTGINKIFNHRWWIILFIGLMAIAGLTIWLRNDKPLPEPAKKPEMQDTLKLNQPVLDDRLVAGWQNPLILSEACMKNENNSQFYSLLNTELKKFLSKKFNIPFTEINTASIAAVMDKRKISNSTVLQLQRFLRELEWKLYTPFEKNEWMVEFYEEAQAIIQLINTYDIRHQ